MVTSLVLNIQILRCITFLCFQTNKRAYQDEIINTSNDGPRKMDQHIKCNRENFTEKLDHFPSKPRNDFIILHYVQ